METFKPEIIPDSGKPKPAEEKNGLEWGIYGPEKVGVISVNLEDALGGGQADLQKAQVILGDPKALRSFVVEGEYGILQRGFEAFLKEKFGPQADIFSVDGKQIIGMLHEAGLPEQYLSELSGVAFHRQDPVMFYRVLGIIFENADLLENKDLVLRARHDRASWKYSVGKNPEAAIDENAQVMSEAKEKSQEILRWKAKLGLAMQKKLKPKDKIGDFGLIAGKMEELDHLYDAHRAKIEEARARVRLASLQSSAQDRTVREDNLESARGLIGEVLEYSRKSGYKKLAQITLKVLEKYGKESGNKQFVREAKETYPL
ncbi:MAG: hypothetical protein U0944_00225 [Candidatus Moranbacteria bacterium]|nr:hypothetical protein [Candidatus Moranbacteria bacterium]